MSSNEKIKCQICGGMVHTIQMHLKTDHPDMTLVRYQEMYPGEPILSEFAKAELAKSQAARAAAGKSSVNAIMDRYAKIETQPRPLHELFDLGQVKAAFGASGKPIGITTLVNVDQSVVPVPLIDPNYVFDIDNLKHVLMGFDLNMPVYVCGMHGTGKTTLLEQVSARTNRCFMRVQHVVSTEESHIVGQYVVKEVNGVPTTVFELGPLPLAMKNGWVYCADEYDIAMPAVIALYQAVLEGKPLIIKEADQANRIIYPHPQFRFCATGNTNGSGDETGLFQGTNVQNAANYDRFGIMIEQKYMEPAMEKQILRGQARLSEEDATKLVEFATEIRGAFATKKIAFPISTRALINAGRVGVRRASFQVGLTVSFINKLSSVDREVATGLAQRIFDTN